MSGTSTWKLLSREVAHRKLNFGFGLVAVFAATLLVVGGLGLLRSDGERTGALVALQRSAVEKQNAELEEAMRVISKRMGFNVVIMPRGQNLDDPFAEDYASKLMPEEYADRLASSSLVTVNHLLPTLEQRVRWPERGGRDLFLVGVRGQVPAAHRDARQPIMQPVPPRGIVLGSSLAEREGLKAGGAVTLLGEELAVTEVSPRRGDKRDLTAWIDLDLMQKLFDKEGKINAIWALECSCAMADVGKVRAELERILPDVHIEEQGEKALARAEMRKEALEQAEKALAGVEADRARHAAKAERFRIVFVPLIIVLAGLWLALVAAANVRERRVEIGLLYALGVRARKIAALFLSRAVLCGLAGAVPGYFAGAALAAVHAASAAAEGGAAPASSASSGASASLRFVFEPGLFIAVLVLAPALSAVACWLPALAATQEDPAVVLRAE
jgi:hypothetical protein